MGLVIFLSFLPSLQTDLNSVQYMQPWKRTLYGFSVQLVPSDYVPCLNYTQLHSILCTNHREIREVRMLVLVQLNAKIMNSTEVQNPQHKLDVFGSVLANAKTAHVFQKLSYSLYGLCLFRH